MIRVVIADDSPVAADLLAAMLEKDPELRVVAVARTGAEAVELARALKPDLLVMDVRMPVMDGIEATAVIMAESPVPILVVSASVGEDTNVAFRAIQAGAIDVVEKPHGTLRADWVGLGLARHARLVAGVPPIRRARCRAPAAAAPPLPPAPVSAASHVLAIGASTGGPVALTAVLGALPADFPCPILVVQHIAAGFLEGLVDWIRHEVRVEVALARHGEPARPGVAYFAPESYHLSLGSDGRLRLLDLPARDGHRPSASVLFESVAESHGPRAVGVLLTGMGRDGAEGLLQLKRRGGHAICQDEASCVIFGMPRVAIEMGAADQVVPVERIAGEVVAALARRAAPAT